MTASTKDSTKEKDKGPATKDRSGKDRGEKKKKKRRKVEKRVVVRPLRIEDFDQLVALQLRCFPGMKPWVRGQIESQLRRFPEGQVCIEVDGRLVASSSSLIVDFTTFSAWHDWSVIADNGYIKNHDPDGDTLYGIEIMVDPEFRGYRLSRRLYDARKQIARDKNLARIIIGGRIPGYAKHAKKMSAREYVERVMAKELHDLVLTAQVSNGFSLQQLIPNYLPSDKESMGYATFLEWKNLDYTSEPRRKWRVVEMIRVAPVQYQMRAITSFDEFAKSVEYFVDVAADKFTDLVVFPELVTTQLMALHPKLRPGLAARKLTEYTSDYVDLFRRLAIKYNVNIVGGSHFTLKDAVLRNTAFLFHRDGRVESQHKLHITPAERRWWGVSPGNSLEVFQTDVAKLAILLCYDVQFPELARIAAAKGAQLLCVPFNTDERSSYLRMRICVQARCVENHLYAVAAGAVGNLPFVDNADTHYAQSGVFTPSDVSFSRDAIGVECTPEVETVLIHDLDLELLRQHRTRGTTTNWLDRRTDIYKLSYGSDEDSVTI